MIVSQFKLLIDFKLIKIININVIKSLIIQLKKKGGLEN
jgi:hypothetical protein